MYVQLHTDWFQIRNKDRPMCADAPINHGGTQEDVSMYPCHGQGGNQVSMQEHSTKY